MKYKSSFNIGSREVNFNQAPYFIADIAANHDGDIERAKDLIYLAKEAGADCAKFQHFKADKIVSSIGFESLENSKMSHQASWKKSVAEIYDQYHTRRSWNEVLIETCKQADIEFMTTPYDEEAMLGLIGSVNAIKIGSGDITYHPFLRALARMNLPLLLATGASTLEDTVSAVDVILEHNPDLCLMQCNTNYTGSSENFKSVNLQVLETFSRIYPQMPLGFSDHTPGHSAVLGSICFGARVIEKHFTDDNERVGPDHHFALNPITWRAMVDASYELWDSLGDGVKRVESNEQDTIVIQRRAIRAKRDLARGHILSENDLECLRPCPEGSLTPVSMTKLLGKPLTVEKAMGETFSLNDV